MTYYMITIRRGVYVVRAIIITLLQSRSFRPSAGYNNYTQEYAHRSRALFYINTLENTRCNCTPRGLFLPIPSNHISSTRLRSIII